ncbi:hypothetical protein G5C51_38525 [Streptomyces sp. A7024]|uniref:Uncharacterized protein n=1 Tax=Streptomyces coryli TaxID=1128680 RepID=A0A6G4UCN6_9ACTN|nr:hypothetical protein [Streptomyces coryli]
MFRAIADILRMIGSTLATIVMLPFRAVARLFNGASSSGRRRPAMGRGRSTGRRPTRGRRLLSPRA